MWETRAYWWNGNLLGRSSQNEQQVFEAAFALKRGTGEFEDALIGTLDAWAGCPHTLTFDKKALRLPYFQLIT